MIAAVLWAVALGAHAIAAAVAWWMLPGGFAVTHPRFWTNRALPAALLALIAASIIAHVARRPRAVAALAAALPALWAAAAVSARIVFPVSAATLWLWPLGVAAALAAGAGALIRRAGAFRAAAPVVAAAALAGALLPLGQRAPEPSTRPTEITLDPAPGAGTSSDLLPLGEALAVDPAGSAVLVQRGALRLKVTPLLTFEDRSPDRAWTALAPRAARLGPGRKLRSARSNGSIAELWYRADDFMVLRAERARSQPGVEATEIEAFTRVPRPVYSHLDTFTGIEVEGHTALSLSFSPCPDAAVDVTYAEVPSGLPLRFAYLDDEGIFRIVEAADAEKGPFRELARGPLGRGEALGITLLDAGVPALRIIFRDWAAQASTALSPTAGWGVATNSIQLRLAARDPRSPAFVSLSLADTGVGRGWDSVGHAAGTYRNRVRID